MLAALLYAVLCAAGSATFATLVHGRRDAAVGAVCAIAAASLMLGGRAVDAVWVGTAAAVAAGLLVARPGGHAVAAACGGALAGFWAANLAAADVPRGVALAVMLLPAASVVLARRRPTFAPPALREEALLFVLVLALLAAAAPVVASGWRMAAALQPGVDGGTLGAAPAWPMAAAAAAFVLGLSFSLWKHR